MEISSSSISTAYQNAALVSSLFSGNTDTSNDITTTLMEAKLAASTYTTQSTNSTESTDSKESSTTSTDETTDASVKSLDDILELSKEALEAYQNEIDSVSFKDPSIATSNLLYSKLTGSSSISSSSSIMDSSELLSVYYN
ncbi:MAG: hypothetical protein PHV68_02920 [Candidatus Gastranaerophilales bacterium]|nr:hypothetical protein [Candidatus Gastranaerophilales bacterium]